MNNTNTKIIIRHGEIFEKNLKTGITYLLTRDNSGYYNGLEKMQKISGPDSENNEGL